MKAGAFVGKNYGRAGKQNSQIISPLDSSSSQSLSLERQLLKNVGSKKTEIAESSEQDACDAPNPVLRFSPLGSG